MSLPKLSTPRMFVTLGLMAENQLVGHWDVASVCCKAPKHLSGKVAALHDGSSPSAPSLLHSGSLFIGIGVWVGLGHLPQKGNPERTWWLCRMLVLRVFVNRLAHVTFVSLPPNDIFPGALQSLSADSAKL
jgi:hypothetical protein